MRYSILFGLLAALVAAPRAAAQEPLHGTRVVVEVAGDTLVYRAVPSHMLRPAYRAKLIPFEQTRHMLSIEVGAFPACGTRGMFPLSESCDDVSFMRRPGTFPGEQRYYLGPMLTTGSIGAVYTYRIKRWLELGVSLSYAGFYRKRLHAADGSVAARLREHYVSLMPGVRFVWLNRPMVEMYSGFQVGYQMGSEKYFEERAYAYHYITGQCTFLGLRVGRRLFGYAEYGVGARGMFLCGIGFRLGDKMKSKP